MAFDVNLWNETERRFGRVDMSGFFLRHDLDRTEWSSLVIIPDWAVSVLNRFKVSIVDVLDKEKLKKYFSVNDLAKIIALNNLTLFSKYSLVDRNFLTADYELVKLSETKSIIDEVLDYFDNTSEKNYQVSKKEDEAVASFNATAVKFHEFIAGYDNRNILVVKPGFVSALSDRGYSIEFFSDCLKMHYSYKPIRDVSTTPVFLSYLNLL